MSISALRQRIHQLSIQEAAVMRSLTPQLKMAGYDSYQDFSKKTGEVFTGKGFGRKLLGLLFFWRRSGESAGLASRVTQLNLPRSIQYTLLELEALQKQVNSFTVEIHKKLSIPFACVIFVLVGGPLGMKARKSGLAIGFASLGFFVFYYIFLLGGEQLADRRLLPPGIAVWMPNIVLGILGLILTLDACEILSLSVLGKRLRPRPKAVNPI